MPRAAASDNPWGCRSHCCLLQSWNKSPALPWLPAAAPARPHRHCHAPHPMLPQLGAPQRGHCSRSSVSPPASGSPSACIRAWSLGRVSTRMPVGSDHGLRAAPSTQTGSNDVTTVVITSGSHPGTVQACPSHAGTVPSPHADRPVRPHRLQVQCGCSGSKGGSGGTSAWPHTP